MARLYFIVNLLFILSSIAGSANATYSKRAPSTSSPRSTSAPSDCAGVKKVTCKPDEEFSNCTQTLCRRLKCSEQGKPVKCENVNDIKGCKRGCVCKAGLLKTANGTCVPESRCYGDLVCGSSEVVNSCPKKCVKDFCPKSENDKGCSSAQDSSEPCGKPVCTCRFNFKRDYDNGTCIPTRNCPPFECSRPYEEYNPCPPLCPSDSCSQATPSGGCPPIFGRIGIVLECRPACRCIKGYWRDKGTCVPYEACPGKCPTNEKYSSCIQEECRVLNCTQKGQPISCPCIEEDSCEKGCVCVEGTLRAANGSCIPEDKCPVVCPAKEEYSNCTQRIYRELNCSQRGRRLDYEEEVEESSCESGCVCQIGYLRTDKGNCVPQNQCYGDLVCKDTEAVDICPNYSFSDRCPTSVEEAQIASKVVSKPCVNKRVCTCKFNYMRAANGSCIPTVDCPPFECNGINEEYNPCPPLCPTDDCSQASPTGRCPLGRIGIVLPCRPNCRCIPGYWRDNGVCVPYAKCPGNCRSNEEFSSCAQSVCRAQNCTQRGKPVPCPKIATGFCEERCVCVEGTLRNSKGDCVPEDQCPAPTCGKNETYNYCPNNCDPISCPESYKMEQERLANCVAPAVCGTARCTCLKDYRRDDNGKCIFIGECPNICPKNEEFSNCIQGLCRAQNCTQIGKPITCPDYVQESCESGCVCKEGTLRNKYGNCVPTKQCKPPTCGKNETYNKCPNNCDPISCPESYKKEQEWLADCFAPAVCGTPECSCLKDYRRDSNGKCIYIGECPNICPKNEEFSNCIQGLCRAQNCTQLGKPIACPDYVQESCQSGCVCKEGTLRDKNGNCVPKKQCKVVCPAREEYSNCTQRIYRELTCSQRGQRLDYEEEVEESSCESGCVCQIGYLRTDKGNCVPQNQCYGDLVCKDTEAVDICPNYSFSDRCPTSVEEAQITSKVVSKPCVSKRVCTCKFNYMRAANGSCIPTVDCPPFECNGDNEEYNPCPPLCPTDDCSQASPTGRCPLGRIGIVLPCRPNCRCIPGYWRDNGVCVPYAKCPGNCKANEEFSSCAQGVCRAQNCTQRGKPVPCPIIAAGSCEERCVCVEGTLRNSKGDCVPEDQCPAPTCWKNETYNYCPNNCDPISCPESYKMEQERLASCIAPAVCGTAGCKCLKDYRRDENGKCIFIGDCPNICPKNEEFSNCIQGLCRAQNCTQLGKPIACPDYVQEYCESGCVCKKGTLRNKYGNCVPTKQCKTPTCGKNETYNECPNNCDPIGCPESYKKEQEWLADCFAPAVCGTPECSCLKDYRRDCNGKCIYIGECPNICPKNEEFSNCIQGLCRAQNCTQLGKPIACPDYVQESCESGCVCKEGTLRNKYGNCVPKKQCKAPPPPQCGQNEVVSCVNDCPSERTCRTRFLQYRCIATNKKCEEKCVCKPGYYRNAIGECITEKECDMCKGSNEFFSCGTECDNDCSNLATQNRTNCPIVNIMCNRKCYCEDGFARDNTNKCVPVDQCPTTPPLQCRQNEIVSCVNECPPEKTCRNRFIAYRCMAPTKKCEDKCICKPGYYRNAIGDCITEKECDMCSGPNEFFSCGSACDNNCSNLATQNRTKCPIVNIVCNRKCYCEDGFARDNTNKCVPVDQCPKSCNCPNEMYVDCKQTCPSELCESIVSRIDCSTEPPCQPGCACKPGFFRANKFSPCVRVCDCPQMKYSSQCPQTVS